MVSDARVLLSESVAFVAICSNDAARNNPPHIPERANNKSNVQHSTAPHLTCYRKSVRNDDRILYIEHSRVWRYVEKTLAHSQPEG